LGHPPVSQKLLAHMDHYAESHHTPVNKALHYFGIPVLTVSVLGLLAEVPLPFDWEGEAWSRPDLAWLALAGLCLWYLWQDWKVGLLVVVFLLGCYAVGRALPVAVLGVLAGAGVLAHVVGHYGFEHKPPALLTRPVAVLEAPAWLLATWFGLR
jgi:uncharacterized membrane protein YGL010W